MISELRLERFKCYHDQRIRFCPLTVLAGTNGAGKSTILQALVLLRLCSESTSGNVPLNGPFGLKLGEVLDVLHHASGLEEGLQLSVARRDNSRSTVIFTARCEQSRVLSIETAHPVGVSLPFEGPGRAFTYLSADRLGPQDAFEAQDFSMADVNVGWRGEGVAQVLVDTERQAVPEPLLRPLLSGHPAPKNISRQSELWLSHIVRPVEIETTAVPRTNVVTLRFKEPGFAGVSTRPANTGFGLSSALPIIVAGLSTDPGGILIVENPETHLHPTAQSLIGSFLARVAGAGIQVVVETHSDHVLNGIRRAAAIERSIPCNDVVIHFFDDELRKSSGASVGIVTLELKENGDVSDWPARFFDQIETDLAALARVRRGT